MTTNTEPNPDKVLAVPSSTSETPTPSQSTLGDSRTLACELRFTPSTQTTTPTTTALSELEQPSVSSTPATRASSAYDNRNDGDDEQEESPDKYDDDDDTDMYEGDVIVPVELTVVPDSILESIPDEIWCLLLSFVPPAKLITLTRVCRRWKLMVERDLIASFWKPLTIQAELLDYSLSLDLDGDSELAEMPIGFIKTFPELVLGHTLVICELCQTRSMRGCGSAIPLPVYRHDTLGRVWMCRPCRREYYEHNPEPERLFRAEDRLSLYGLSGYPPKVVRSTGPPAVHRHYYPRQHWGGFGSRRYYDDYDSFNSTEDEFDESYYATETDLEEDEFDGCYYATEADLEEDERWTKEADACEAARVLVGVMEGARPVVAGDTPIDSINQGQGVQVSAANERHQISQGKESSGAGNIKHDKSAPIVEPEVGDTVVTESSVVDQSNSDAGGTSLDAHDADGKSEIKLVADGDVEVGNAIQGGEVDDTAMDEEPASDAEPVNSNAECKDKQQLDEEEVEEEPEGIDEEDEEDPKEISYDEGDSSDDEAEDKESKELQLPTNWAIVQEARRHHGGDVGIQAHSGSHAQLRIKLQPLRNRLMKTRLGLLGLYLRNDSKLCQDYLNGLMDNPFKVADVMKHMQWYFSATQYSSYIEDSDSSTAKSAAMEQWIEELIDSHGENAKNAYRGLDMNENPRDAVVNVMDADQPPKSLWPVLDSWIEHRLKGDQSWSPAIETFAVRVATDDLQD